MDRVLPLSQYVLLVNASGIWRGIASRTLHSFHVSLMVNQGIWVRIIGLRAPEGEVSGVKDRDNPLGAITEGGEVVEDVKVVEEVKVRQHLD